jgi:DNA-binding NarL/FixJ family response regulator
VTYAQSLPLQGQEAPARGTEHELNNLTRREHEVAALIAQGKSNGEIAGEIFVSKRTVEKHIANILAKLELTQRTQIVRWAVESGVVDFTA